MDGVHSRSQIARLVDLSRQGDEAARELLLAKYRPYLRLMAIQQLPKFLHQRTDGSDIVQQTLLDATRGLPDFNGRSEAEFTAWMHKLLERNLLQSARQHTALKRDVRREAPAADGSAQIVWHSIIGNGASPQSHLFRGESALLLAAALEQLSDEQQIAIELRYLAQQPLDFIAQEMEKTTSAVAGLIRRGVEALRQVLPDELGEP